MWETKTIHSPSLSCLQVIGSERGTCGFNVLNQTNQPNNKQEKNTRILGLVCFFIFVTLCRFFFLFFFFFFFYFCFGVHEHLLKREKKEAERERKEKSDGSKCGPASMDEPSSRGAERAASRLTSPGPRPLIHGPFAVSARWRCGCTL